MYDAWLEPKTEESYQSTTLGSSSSTGVAGVVDRALGFAVGLYLAFLLLVAIGLFYLGQVF